MNPNTEKLLRAVVATFCKKTPDPAIHFFHPNQFTLQVHAHDCGRLVGKGGIVIWALQTLLWYAGMANTGQPFALRLLEPIPVPKDVLPPPFRPKSELDKKRWGEFVDLILQTCMGMDKGSWVIEDFERVVMRIRLEKYLKVASVDPAIDEAIQIIVHAAGMANGVNMEVVVEWGKN